MTSAPASLEQGGELLTTPRGGDRDGEAGEWEIVHVPSSRDVGTDRTPVFTADRLQRTASWLDTAIARHVGSYSDQWADTLADPQRLARFSSFVNAPDEAGPEHHLRPVARPDPTRGAGPGRGSHAAAGAFVSGWLSVCRLEQLPVDRGVAALLHGRQVALPSRQG